MPVDPVLSFSSRAAGSSAALQFWGRIWATWPGCLQKLEGIFWFHVDSCSWCLRKEDMLPSCLDRKLPDGREKQENELHLEKGPHSVEQLGYRTKCFSCFLTFGGSFQTTGELFSSFLSAPEVVLKGRLRGRMKSLFQFPRLITAWLECDVFISSWNSVPFG